MAENKQELTYVSIKVRSLQPVALNVKNEGILHTRAKKIPLRRDIYSIPVNFKSDIFEQLESNPMVTQVEAPDDNELLDITFNSKSQISNLPVDDSKIRWQKNKPIGYRAHISSITKQGAHLLRKELLNYNEVKDIKETPRTKITYECIPDAQQSILQKRPEIRLETQNDILDFSIHYKTYSRWYYEETFYVPLEQKDQIVQELKENLRKGDIHIHDTPQELVALNVTYVEDADFSDNKFEAVDKDIVVPYNPNEEKAGGFSSTMYVSKQKVDSIINQLKTDSKIATINGTPIKSNTFRIVQFTTKIESPSSLLEHIPQIASLKHIKTQCLPPFEIDILVPKSSKHQIIETLKDHDGVMLVEEANEATLIGDVIKLRVKAMGLKGGNTPPKIPFKELGASVNSEWKSSYQHTFVVPIDEFKNLENDTPNNQFSMDSDESEYQSIELTDVFGLNFEDFNFKEVDSSIIVGPSNADANRIIYVSKNHAEQIISTLKDNERVATLNGKKIRSCYYGADFVAAGPIDFKKIDERIIVGKSPGRGKIVIYMPIEIGDDVNVQLFENPQITLLRVPNWDNLDISITMKQSINFEKIDKRIKVSETNNPNQVTISIPKDQFNTIMEQLEKLIDKAVYRESSVSPTNYKGGGLPKYNKQAAIKERQLKPLIDQLVVLENKIKKLRTRHDNETSIDKREQLQEASHALEYINFNIRALLKDYIYSPNYSLSKLESDWKNLMLEFEPQIKTLEQHRGYKQDILEFILTIVTFGIAKLFKKGDEPLIKVHTDSSSKFEALRKTWQTMKETEEERPQPGNQDYHK